MNAVMNIQDAVLVRGQRAWGKLKATAAEQRQLWREVGEALNYGRAKEPSNQRFGAWCKEHGFDMDAPTRSDAMWFATSSYDDPKTTLTHPTAIRKAHREAQAPEAVVPEALPDAEAAIAAEVLKHHRRYKATSDHSKGTGPEAEIAKRQYKATAAKLGVTESVLDDLVDKLDPYGKMAPNLRQGLKDFMAGISKDLKNMLQSSKGVVQPEFVLAYIALELKG